MSKQKNPTTTRVFDDALFKLEIEPIIEAWDANGDVEILESRPITLTAVDDPNLFMFDTVTLYIRKMRNFAEQFEGIYRRIWHESVGPETPEVIAKKLRPRLLAAIEERAQATRDRWSRIRFLRGGNEHALMRFEPELLKLKKESERHLTIEARRLSLHGGDDPRRPTARDSNELTLRQILASKGLSFRDWAGKAGVDVNTALAFSKDRVSPYPSTVKKLADALGISAAKLRQLKR